MGDGRLSAVTVNRSAQASAVVLVASLVTIGIAFLFGSGYGFQVAGFLAFVIAVAGIGLGFVGLTVARKSGAPLLWLALVAMVANTLVALGLLVLAVARTS